MCVCVCVNVGFKDKADISFCISLTVNKSNEKIIVNNV